MSEKQLEDVATMDPAFLYSEGRYHISNPVLLVADIINKHYKYPSKLYYIQDILMSAKTRIDLSNEWNEKAAKDGRPHFATFKFTFEEVSSSVSRHSAGVPLTQVNFAATEELNYAKEGAGAVFLIYSDNMQLHIAERMTLEENLTSNERGTLLVYTSTDKSSPSREIFFHASNVDWRHHPQKVDVVYAHNSCGLLVRYDAKSPLLTRVRDAAKARRDASTHETASLREKITPIWEKSISDANDWATKNEENGKLIRMVKRTTGLSATQFYLEDLKVSDYHLLASFCDNHGGDWILLEKNLKISIGPQVFFGDFDGHQDFNPDYLQTVDNKYRLLISTYEYLAETGERAYPLGVVVGTKYVIFIRRTTLQAELIDYTRNHLHTTFPSFVALLDHILAFGVEPEPPVEEYFDY